MIGMRLVPTTILYRRILKQIIKQTQEFNARSNTQPAGDIIERPGSSKDRKCYSNEKK
jgi:hypothetical protein